MYWVKRRSRYRHTLPLSPAVSSKWLKWFDFPAFIRLEVALISRRGISQAKEEGTLTFKWGMEQKAGDTPNHSDLEPGIPNSTTPPNCCKRCFAFFFLTAVLSLHASLVLWSYCAYSFVPLFFSASYHKHFRMLLHAFHKNNFLPQFIAISSFSETTPSF